MSKTGEYGFTIADLERRQRETGLGFTDQMNAEELSAAVSGSTGHVSIGRTPTEAEDQQAVVDWCEANGYLVYANVNGQYRAGERPEPGLKRGIPDLFVPVPHLNGVSQRGEHWYHGLYLELKRDGRQNEKPSGGLSPDQVRWIEILRSQGYYVAVTYGRNEALGVIERYMNGEL